MARYFAQWCLVLWLTGILSSVHAAKAEIKNDALGFSFELPTGFLPAPNAAVGGEDVLYGYSHSLVGNGGYLTITIKRLHKTLPEPALPLSAGVGTERWKFFPLRVEHWAEGMRVQVPLSPEAIEVSVSGPSSKEKRVELTLHSILATLDGTPSWSTTKPTARASSDESRTNGRAGVSGASNTGNPNATPAAAGKSGNTPDPVAQWLAIGLSIPVIGLLVWAFYRRIGRLPVTGRWLVLSAGGLGIFLFALTEQFSFGAGKGGGLWVGMVIGAAMMGFGIYRFMSYSKADHVAAATAPSSGWVNNNMDLSTKSDAQIRKIGALFVLLGLVGIYFTVVLPLQEAAQHKERISYTEYAALFVPFLLGFGISACVMGRRITTLSVRTGQVHKVGVVVLIALGVLGVLLLLWLKMRLHDLGYHRG